MGYALKIHPKCAIHAIRCFKPKRYKRHLFVQTKVKFVVDAPLLFSYLGFQQAVVILSKKSQERTAKINTLLLL